MRSLRGVTSIEYYTITDYCTQWDPLLDSSNIEITGKSFSYACLPGI